jgi:hypothetical protein
MNHTLFAVTLSLFATPMHAAEKPAPQKNVAQQEQWDKDAEQFARIVHAMGGKMLENKSLDKKESKKEDKQAKL